MYSMRPVRGVWLILMLTFLTPSLTVALKTYEDCASIWITDRVGGSTSCLPPTTDCLCYADGWYVQGAAIDIAGKCQGADALQNAADTYASNCAELGVKPALDGNAFFAAGRSPASDTIFSIATSFDINTVPAAATATGVTTSVLKVSYPTQGVTTIPGPGAGPCITEMSYNLQNSLACDAASSEAAAATSTISVEPATSTGPIASSTSSSSSARKSGISQKGDFRAVGFGLLCGYWVLGS